MFSAVLAAHLLFLLPCIQAFYLPGAAPHNYVEGEKVELYVNALTPMLSGSSDAKLVSIPSKSSMACGLTSGREIPYKP